MSASLKRTDTIWPRASLESRKEHASNESVDANIPDTKHSLPVPEPTIAARYEAPRQLVRSRAAGLRNVHAIPTASSLSHSIVVTTKSVWDLYEAIEYCANQGDNYCGRTMLSRRKRASTARQEGLSVVKQHRVVQDNALKHFTKPQSQYLVELYAAFHTDTCFWMLYEEMDLSLEQVLALDHDPWVVNPELKYAQIAAIAAQVLKGIEYIVQTFKTSHGAINDKNILLNRTGQVKIANVGVCVLFQTTLNSETDLDSLAGLLTRLLLPPDACEADLEACIEATAYSFLSAVRSDRLVVALQHEFIAQAQPACLARLAIRTMRTIYDPPNPVVYGINNVPVV